jgi:hypothetical protein
LWTATNILTDLARAWLNPSKSSPKSFIREYFTLGMKMPTGAGFELNPDRDANDVHHPAAPVKRPSRNESCLCAAAVNAALCVTVRIVSPSALNW